MSEHSLIGKRLDEYHILSQLGEGGMSTIYLGLDTRLQRYTAIKVIHTRLQNDPDSVARFKREAQAVARLDHPNIVRLYRYGQVEDILYMAMQYIEGVDLRVVLQNYRQDRELIPPADAVRIVTEVCRALDYSHKHGVLHRDVKPSNIMLTREGQAILTDFGLALIPEVDTQGKAFGTPQYMAPEQAQSPGDVGPKSDLYAVGMIMYEMFTGEVPFHEIENPMEMVARRATTPPPRPGLIQPDIGPELEGVILKALSLDPTERYESGAELSAALADSLPLPILEPEAAEVVVPATVEEEAEVVALPPPPRREARTSQAALPPPPPLFEEFRVSSTTPAARRLGLPVPLLAIGGCAIVLLLALVLIGGGYQFIQGLLEDRFRTWMPLTVADEGGGSGSGYPGSGNEPNPGSSGEAGVDVDRARLVLQVVTNNDDSFFLINTGNTDVPLALFRFNDGENEFEAAEWGVESLAPGQCVSIWKDRGNPRPPDVACEEVGSRAERAPSEMFWRKPFNIIFSNNPITTCSEDGCEFFIPA